MKGACKVSNFHGKVHFKQKERLCLLEIHLSTENSPVKA